MHLWLHLRLILLFLFHSIIPYIWFPFSSHFRLSLFSFVFWTCWMTLLTKSANVILTSVCRALSWLRSKILLTLLTKSANIVITTPNKLSFELAWFLIQVVLKRPCINPGQLYSLYWGRCNLCYAQDGRGLHKRCCIFWRLVWFDLKKLKVHWTGQRHKPLKTWRVFGTIDHFLRDCELRNVSAV